MKPSTALLDREFSQFIRRRDSFTCQRCASVFPENAFGLHASHFIGRAVRATRWDPENVDAMCNGCHGFFEARKATAYRAWKIDQLGPNRFDALVERSNTVKKWRTDELVVLRASWRSAA